MVFSGWFCAQRSDAQILSMADQPIVIAIDRSSLGPSGKENFRSFIDGNRHSQLNGLIDLQAVAATLRESGVWANKKKGADHGALLFDRGIDTSLLGGDVVLLGDLLDHLQVLANHLLAL